MDIIPAIDIIDGKCVRLTKGDYNACKTYSDNPLDMALRFQDAGIRRLHLVDLDGAKSKHIVNYPTLEAITAHTDLTVDFGGGAYYGIGLGVSNISHKLNVEKNNGTKLSNKQSATQFDISLIGGFGAAFYDRYYAGIEFDFFKRMPKKTKNFGESGVVHKSNFGLNMDVRFGYQFPQYGILAYITAGFARVLGEMGAYNNGNNIAKMTFGSFFPTVGFGLEHRVNQTINLRGDVRFTIGSKEKKEAKVNGTTWNFEAKPNRYAFRISVTKSI